MKQIFGLLIFLSLAGCAIKPLPNEMGSVKYGIDVTWHGHSCFTLKDSVNRTLVIDPYDPTIGYGTLRLSADAVLITHHHFDHDFRSGVRSRARMIDLVDSTGTTHVAAGLIVTGISTSHDSQQGQIFGSNTMYAFQMGGLRCLHLGDIGQENLTQFQIKMIGIIDVLFIPVGGVSTIDAVQAKKIVDELKPGAVFPMHYGDVRFYKFDPIKKFIDLFPEEQVVKSNSSSVRVRLSDLTDKPIVYILAAPNLN